MIGKIFVIKISLEILKFVFNCEYYKIKCIQPNQINKQIDAMNIEKSKNSEIINKLQMANYFKISVRALCKT